MDKGLNARDDGGLFPRLQQRYGLRADPLEMEAPFYPDAARQHALETLRHLCGFGDLALLLLGAPGMGKTRILSELVRAARRATVSAMSGYGAGALAGASKLTATAVALPAV